MNRRSRWQATLVALLLVAVTPAVADEFSSLKYRFFSGDINGDGFLDLYLERKPDIVIIASTPVIPLALERNAHYLMQGTPSGVFSAPILTSAMNVSGLSLLESGVSFGDFNGDGRSDVLIQGESVGDHSVLLSGSEPGVSPWVLQQFVELNRRDVSLASAVVTLEDRNTDGYDDLVLNYGAGASVVIFNAGTGMFDLMLPNTPPEPQLAVVPSPSTSSESVGVIQGEFRVDESGAATYQIPISGAPGIAGVEPQIALRYSSQGGNGPVGQGWSISRLSAITRCRQTLVTDGDNEGVSFGPDDRFCLDGQRLMRDPSGPAYGHPGSEYRTEVDSFARIRANGGTAGNPASFTVWRKDGSVSEYGVTGDSALDLPDDPGTIAVWAQSRMEDSVGNWIDFTYSESIDGEHQISRIEYAGGDAAIQFVYEDRGDKYSRFQGGSEFKTTERLAEIRVLGESDVELKTFYLDYQLGTHSGVSQLTQIEVCNGSTCLLPTTFAWSNPAIGSDALPTGWHDGGFLGGRPADFDGDGINELVFMSPRNNGTFHLRLLTPNGSTWAADTSFAGGGIVRARSEVRNSWSVVDFNNDGMDDLIYAKDTGWYLRYGTDQGGYVGAEVLVAPLSVTEARTTIGDIDGDGLPDLVWSSGEDIKARHLVQTGSQYDFGPEQTYSVTRGAMPAICSSWTHGCNIYPEKVKPIVQDFNGDGAVDIALNETVTSYCTEAELCGGETPQSQQRWRFFVSRSGSFEYFWHLGDMKPEEFRLADINGDGLPDLLQGDVDGSSNSWSYKLNTGTGFGSPTTLSTSLAKRSAEQLQVIDYNGDGDGDVLYPSGTYWMVRQWNGSIFQGAVSTGLPSYFGSEPDRWHTTFFDGNGDGKLDAVVGHEEDGSGANEIHVEVHRDPHVAASVIEEFENGLGARTEITYAALTDPNQASDFFVPSTDADSMSDGQPAPLFDINAPLWVAQNVTSSAPAAGTSAGNVDTSAMSSISYRYAGPKMQAGGRGFLGFESVVSIDDQTQIETTTIYRQDFPFIGRPETTEVRKNNGDLLSDATNTWDTYGPSSADPWTQPYLQQVVERTYDLASQQLLQTVTTTMAMANEYGDVGSVTVQTSDGANTYSKTTSNSYFSPDLNKWHLGRLSQVTVDHYRSDGVGGMVTRTSSFTYNSDGILDSETVEPGGASDETLTTTYSQFCAGNAGRVTQTGWRGTPLTGDTTPEVVSRYTETTYDTDCRYVVQKTNAYGHVVEKVNSRNELGAATQTEDVNGVETDYYYGDLGRPYFQRDETGAYSHTTRGLCSTGCPADAAFWVRTQSAGGGESYQYSDMLGREVRTATKMFDGQWSVVAKEYDSLGRVKRQSEPFEASTPGGTATGSGAYWTTFFYDDLGRVVETRHPDYGATGNSTTAVYTGLQVEFTNAKGQKRWETRNAVGDLVLVTDHLGGSVEFEYDHQGNLATTTQDGPLVGPAVTNIGHDSLGRKTTMADPNMGNWSYEYNAFGELITQTNAKGDVTRIRYDLLGRMIRRIDEINGMTVESDSAWIYDTATNGRGQLHMEDTYDGSSTPIRRTFAYDRFGRTDTVQTEIARGAGTETYTEAMTYDEYGRVFQKFDASGENAGLEYLYNSNGYVSSVIEAQFSSQETSTYYAIQDMDARGNVVQMLKGSMTVTRLYDEATGTPDEILTQDVAYQTIQHLTLDFDVLGNLTTRLDQSKTGSGTYKNIEEAYSYDDLNRLSRVDQDQTRTLELTFDALGNIKTKRAYRPDTGAIDSNADVGTYIYGSRPHAVTNAGGVSYGYDANGSMVSGDGRSISYSVFNKPVSITRGSSSVDIYYGPNRNRYKRVDDLGSASESQTHYVGDVERIWKPSGQIVTKRYLGGEAIHTTTELSGSSQVELQYLLKDHLGSTDLITDVVGVIGQAQSFDAFGMRRADIDFLALSIASRLNFDVSHTTRGYTGHEGLDTVGLVHMNGRVYDPRLGRFTAADPYVEARGYTQGFNRYSYVWNNPLSATDPSGHFVFSLGAIAIAATGAVKGSVAVGVLFGVAGFGDAILQGASFQDALKAGLLSGVSAATFSAIGQKFTGIGTNNLDGATSSGGNVFTGAGRKLHKFGNNLLTRGQISAQISAHALAGGVFNALAGGRFGHGFLSAGIVKGISPVVSGVDGFQMGDVSIGQAVAAAVVGGTVSAITGGKFANGAAMGAFQNLFNQQSLSARPNLTADDAEVIAEGIRKEVVRLKAGLNARDPTVIRELNIDLSSEEQLYFTEAALIRIGTNAAVDEILSTAVWISSELPLEVGGNAIKFRSIPKGIIQTFIDQMFGFENSLGYSVTCSGGRCRAYGRVGEHAFEYDSQ